MKNRQFIVLLTFIMLWFALVYMKQQEIHKDIILTKHVVDRNYTNLYNLRLFVTWPRKD